MEVTELSALQSAYAPGQVQLASRGRPRFDIGQDQLEYLSSMSFTWTQIASMLGVSRMTIYRRRVEFGMSHDGLSSNITDEELAVILRQMRRENPALGERMVMGHLCSMGFKITRSRVRDSIRNTDPIQTALRWRGQLAPRQPYSVPGPNSLWHIGKILFNAKLVSCRDPPFSTALGVRVFHHQHVEGSGNSCTVFVCTWNVIRQSVTRWNTIPSLVCKLQTSRAVLHNTECSVMTA